MTTDRYDHFRFIDVTTKLKVTWKETLQSMCDYYGTFCGRWHSNSFWQKTAKEIPSMTEEQCRNKVIEIEREADAELEYWRQMQ